jgi:hypothetical protein
MINNLDLPMPPLPQWDLNCLFLSISRTGTVVVSSSIRSESLERINGFL